MSIESNSEIIAEVNSFDFAEDTFESEEEAEEDEVTEAQFVGAAEVEEQDVQEATEEDRERKRYYKIQGKRKCVNFTLQFKIQILKEMQAKNIGAKAMGRLKNIPPSTILNWKRQGIDKLCDETNTRVKRHRKKPNEKLQGSLIYDENITTYVRDMHRSGCPVNRTGIIAYAKRRFPIFREKNYWASHMWVSRFIKRMKLADHVVQHSGSIIQIDLQEKKDSIAFGEKGAATNDSWREKTLHRDEVNDREKQAKKNEKAKGGHQKKQRKQKATKKEVAEQEWSGYDSDVQILVAQPSPRRSKRKKSGFVTTFNFNNIENDNGPTLPVHVTDEDLKSLDPGQWLHGPVLTYYSKRYLTNEMDTKFYLFGTDFYGTLACLYAMFASKQQLDPELSRDQWHRDNSLFTCKFNWGAFPYLFVPIHCTGHWSLMIIENAAATQPVYYHLDSLAGCHYPSDILDILEWYIAEDLRLYPHKKSTIASAGQRDPIKTFLKTKPQQTNTDDCGVYCLWYIQKISSEIREKELFSLQTSITKLATGCNVTLATKLRVEIKKMICHDSRNHYEIEI
jgi:hypothetical protein